MTASRIAIAAYLVLGSAAAFGQFPTAPVPANPPQGQTNGANGTNGTNGKTQDNGNRNSPAYGGPVQNNGDTKDSNAPKDGPQVGDAQNADPNAKPLLGPDIVDDPNATPEQKASAEYSGPAVLSRGISASSPMNPQNVRFRPTVGLEYVVNSGLTGVTVQSDGKLQDQVAEGLQLSYGINGEKVFKRDTFGLTFSGNLYHYANESSLDGTDNELLFNWKHKLSRHLSFGVRESFQEYNRNNLLLSGSQLINSGLGSTLVTASPATEAFDGRVLSLLNEGDITWQINSRLSINLQGGGFFTRRASSALYGDTGYQGGGDVVYRISRRVSTGVYYSYTHFDFTGIYGGSDINTVGFTYSIAFNPRTQFITRIGGSRVETTGIQTVALDPFLALIFGTSSTQEAVYSKNFSPDIDVQLRHRVSNLSFSMAYARGVTPGNGVILTSTRQDGSVGVDYKTPHRWTLSSSAGYDSLSSFGATNLKYASVYLGGSVYRKIARSLEWHSRLDFHHYTFDNTGFLRNSVVFSTGVVWSPGDILERLW